MKVSPSTEEIMRLTIALNEAEVPMKDRVAIYSYQAYCTACLASGSTPVAYEDIPDESKES